jgi:hypothetical protein
VWKFDLAAAAPASVTAFEAQTCVDDRCVEQSGRRGESTWVFVRLEDVSSERVATARLTLRSGGAVVFQGTTPVTLKKHQPNGPRFGFGWIPTVTSTGPCEPTTVDSDGRRAAGEGRDRLLLPRRQEPRSGFGAVGQNWAVVRRGWSIAGRGRLACYQ